MKKKVLLTLLTGAMTLNVGCFGKNENKTNETLESTESTSEKLVNEDSEELSNTSLNLLQFSEIKEGEEVAVIKTTLGDIKIRFFKEQAPKAVENFLTHSKNGYYNGIIFHRVIEDFMIQGGDPEGTGYGGESIWGENFEDEISLDLRHFNGALSMANGGANTNASQFFIVQNKELSKEYKEQLVYFIENQEESREGVKIKEVYPKNIAEKYLEVGGTPHLDGKHTIFGQVYEGMDVVDSIAKVEKDSNDKPIKDVIINSIEVMEYKKQ